MELRIRAPFSWRSTTVPLLQRAPARQQLCWSRRHDVSAAAGEQPAARPEPLPTSFNQAIRQAQASAKAALADGCKLIEVEFPVAGLTAAQGDADGQSEMNSSMEYLRQFMSAFASQAATTRIFFPEQGELNIARMGQTSDPAAGRSALEPKFAGNAGAFQFGTLTKQNAAWALLGVNLDKFSPAQQVADSDSLFVVAYPSFNPKEELGAVQVLWEQSAVPRGVPIIMFNAELDRVRAGYYPPLFFPSIKKWADTLLPKVETAYYIHNFKGSRPGVLFRAYPGPWQVLRRDGRDSERTQLVWSSDKQPSLKEVALEILPGAVKLL